MYHFLFVGTATNYRRWKQCACGAVALLAVVIALLAWGPEPASGSRGLGPLLGYLLIAVGGLAIYWMALLMKLCETMRMNAALWMFLAVAFAPLSILVIHLLMAPKVEVYLGDGGT